MARLMAWGLAVVLLAGAARGQETAGWRGNWTGLWPEARGVTEWSRVPTGATAGLRGAATRPVDEAAGAGAAALLRDGMVRDWLLLGPIAVEDSVKQFDGEQIPGESSVRPAEGEKVGELSWRPFFVPAEDKWQFGTTELAWVSLEKAIEYRPNQVAYLHSYLWAERAGKLRAVVEHGFGLKVWVNGQAVYGRADRQGALGSFQQFGRLAINNENPHAPVFELELKQGWNRLLCKVTSQNKPGWNEMRLAMHLMERPDARYEEKSILWKAELPNRSTSTPILVGERIFVMADPDELICLDKNTGKKLWSAFNDYYEATPAAERDANPAFKATVEPLVAELKATEDFDRRCELRRKLAAALSEIDKKKYAPKVEGHMEGHFGVVGYSLPTPCSDGKYVYVFCGTGVVACYDLEGKRQWITRLDVPILVYPCSPALVGNTFAVFIGHLRGLDKRTGQVMWEQKSVNKSTASLLPGKLAGVEVVISQQGEVIRASDGHVLWANPDKAGGDTGWNAPVLLDQTLYLPWYGAGLLNLLDFSQCSGEEWEPKRTRIDGIVHNRRPDGQWVDRWAAASWLIHDGLGYCVDIYKTLYIVDIQSKQTLVRQELDFGGLMHYNALPVAASPTLIGKYIYILNNQGETIVIEPGRSYKPVAKNVLGTQLPRVWAIPPQETLSYAPPITDGKRIYLRGEKYLYCIGEK